MVNLDILPRSKNLRKIKCDTDPKTRVKSIIDEYARVNKVNPNRIKFSFLPDEDDKDTKRPVRIALKNEQTLEQNGLDFSKSDSLAVYAKDVGPQIDWRTVYFIEYLGPIILQSLIYFAWYDATNNTWTQKFSYIMCSLHYLKREYETLFIHSFSSDTMPLKHLFRNSGHYWILNGLLIGIAVYAPQDQYYTGIYKYLFHVEDRPIEVLFLFAAAWVFCQASNYYCHLILMNLRPLGSREHKIPYGYFFEYVSFPNYFFESLGWLVFAIMNNNWASYLFFAVGTATMMMWAAQKHRRYKKEFGDKYPSDRKAMIPLIF
ncbi:hypothetical protein CANARDRAFT_6459 [[Candida] arabinofermentans NRRL YB-2248]|uniref:3-oxo-5-alpha-steroid 4-dehydrogenase C-terminal domain-containing protein n=1 Tax=[Candida] arabinofermentans NRRL YB-2248 TaxID=983967 RepID=A0A1E4T563_9ASCO|nr:hypothetical protein CANARDRAFT_6459 [[Candida] arabinofermentans NRRL YB-2248]